MKKNIFERKENKIGEKNFNVMLNDLALHSSFLKQRLINVNYFLLSLLFTLYIKNMVSKR